MKPTLVVALCLIGACQPDLSGPATREVDAVASEMFNPATRLSPTSKYATINAHVYGSFALDFGTSAPSVIASGPAHFPGHGPNGPGTCDDGAWINPQGRRTAGSYEMPHPHCIAPAQPLQVVLEPVTSCFDEIGEDRSSLFGTCINGARPAPGEGATHRTLVLGEQFDAFFAGPIQVTALSFTKGDFTSGSTSGGGKAGLQLSGYAVNLATGERVGTLHIPLEQYTSRDTDHFATDCTVDGATTPCLNHVVMASYKPLPAEEGGVGEFVAGIPGFLWISPASTPYRYDAE